VCDVGRDPQRVEPWRLRDAGKHRETTSTYIGVHTYMITYIGVHTCRITYTYRDSATGALPATSPSRPTTAAPHNQHHNDE
jgi:hypothetical protein